MIKEKKSENVGLNGPILYPKKKKKTVFLFYIYNFCFENLIYKWIKQFKINKRERLYCLGNVLVGVKVVFLANCHFVLSLPKHKK